MACTGLAAAALSVTACSPVRTSPPHELRADPSASAPGATTTAPLAHVVIIVEENKSAANVIGNSAAPFINTLAADNAVAADYVAVTHPSLPNYLALTSGTTAGITDDCNPPGAGCTANVTSIADRIEESGRSWAMYAEDMPEPCAPDNSGTYAVKHNPFMYYPGITGNIARCRAHVLSFSDFGAALATTTTLPDYVFISPDLCNDMHDCPVRTGDDWLSHQVPAILSSPAFTRQNSLLVVVWDEDEGGTNPIPAIFAGPAARSGFTSRVRYDHYSLLHTIENAWNLSPLTANDSRAPVMNDLLR
jgi:phosphatidylinositol-3-phosphatase